ncbi:hypothetical protein X975_04494, partial [Stegodyphus mimosarum]
MLCPSAPRTNTVQSWVNPSDVGFSLRIARWPNSILTSTLIFLVNFQNEITLKFLRIPRSLIPEFHHTPKDTT